MSKLTPASKSQVRAASLLAISIDAADYVAAGEALMAAGAPKDGLPSGLDWRQAGKLDDAALLARLGRSAPSELDLANRDSRAAHAEYVASTTARERRAHTFAAGRARLYGERETGDERIDDFARRGPSRDFPMTEA